MFKNHIYKVGQEVKLVRPFFIENTAEPIVVRLTRDLQNKPLYVIGSKDQIDQPEIIQDVNCLVDVPQGYIIPTWLNEPAVRLFIQIKAFIRLTYLSN